MDFTVSRGRKTYTNVYIWLRETSSSTLTVEVMKGWRDEEVDQTLTVNLHPTDDVPPFWGSSNLGGTDADGDPLTWKRRRPHWVRGQIYVPSEEVIKLRLRDSDEFEFIGLSFDVIPKFSGGSRIPN